jgi:hypothetical protein
MTLKILEKYEVTLTVSQPYCAPVATTSKGEAPTSDQLFRLVEELTFLAQKTLDRELAKALVLDKCYVFRFKHGLGYVQYKGEGPNGSLVQRISKEGKVENYCIEDFFLPVARLSLMTVQPTVSNCLT